MVLRRSASSSRHAASHFCCPAIIVVQVKELCGLLRLRTNRLDSVLPRNINFMISVVDLWSDPSLRAALIVGL